MQLNQFLSPKHKIRLIEEELESHRRKMVLDGKWTEEESYLKKKETAQHLTAKQPTAYQLKQMKRLHELQYEKIEYMKRIGDIEEREYYFDEGMGQTLEEHIKEIKSNMEGVKVETRRDRDGFLIIKTKIVKEYKYNLD